MIFLESNIFSSIIWHYLMILQTLANLAENEEKSCAMYNLPFKKPFFSMEFQDPKSESRLPVNNLLQLIRTTLIVEKFWDSKRLSFVYT